MNDIILKNLSTFASLVFVSAYIPQIIHLFKVKDSTGIDLVAWSIWLGAALVLATYAIHIRGSDFHDPDNYRVVGLAYGDYSDNPL